MHLAARPESISVQGPAVISAAGPSVQGLVAANSVPGPVAANPVEGPATEANPEQSGFEFQVPRCTDPETDMDEIDV